MCLALPARVAALLPDEMAVVNMRGQQIAGRVAVMSAGRVVESGDVYDVFAAPQQPVTKEVFDAYVAQLRPLDLENTGAQSEASVDMGNDCAGGACPVR